LSGLVDNAISHDPVTRFLSQQDCTSKELGKVIKQTVREIETGEGVLIFDDTLVYKSKISGVFIAYYFNGNIIRVRNISY
jgi:hypothetical protein